MISTHAMRAPIFKVPGKYVTDSYEITPGKRILIAGGGGFIGSHLSKRLMEQDKYYTVCRSPGPARLQAP